MSRFRTDTAAGKPTFFQFHRAAGTTPLRRAISSPSTPSGLVRKLRNGTEARNRAMLPTKNPPRVPGSRCRSPGRKETGGSGSPSTATGLPAETVAPPRPFPLGRREEDLGAPDWPDGEAAARAGTAAATLFPHRGQTVAVPGGRESFRLRRS